MLRWRGIDQVLMKDIQSLLQGKAIRLRLQKKSVKNRLEIALRPRRLAGQPVGSPLVDRLSFVFVLGGRGWRLFGVSPHDAAIAKKTKQRRNQRRAVFLLPPLPIFFLPRNSIFFGNGENRHDPVKKKKRKENREQPGGTIGAYF